jgi:cobalamin biosynthesis protein CobT
MWMAKLSCGRTLVWKSSAKKKILFVISEGAPVDECISSVNPSRFLTKHLASVAMSIENAKLVELHAVGLDYDNPFYSVSEAVDSSKLGVPILEYVFKASYREAMRMETIKDDAKRR